MRVDVFEKGNLSAIVGLKYRREVVNFQGAKAIDDSLCL